MRTGTTTLVLAACIGLACQTRGQAKIVAVSTGSIGLVGGYFESQVDEGPPIALIGSAAIAIIATVSIFFLDDRPRTVFGRDVPLVLGTDIAIDVRPTISLDEWEPATRRENSELLVAIQRTGCLGRCPAYAVALYRDGSVVYVGESNVDREGTATGTVRLDQVTRLERRLAAANLLALDAKYSSHDCTDWPSVYVWYRPQGGPTTSIVHYLGDRSAPLRLHEVEVALDAEVNIEQWIGQGRHHSPAATFCHRR